MKRGEIVLIEVVYFLDSRPVYRKFANRSDPKLNELALALYLADIDYLAFDNFKRFKI